MKYESARRSDPALLAEYGLEGERISVSLKELPNVLPYTSSVEMWMNFEIECIRAHSRRVWVPTTFVITNADAFEIDRSTWLSAAK